MHSNPYTKMLPQPPAPDNRKAIESLRLFAEALRQYAGQDVDVEVPFAVHPEDGPNQTARVQISVYVPKTDYANLVLIARCQGVDGFPVTIDPYFAGGSFPSGIAPCRDQSELDDALKQFAESPEVSTLLDYMRRHAQPN